MKIAAQLLSTTEIKFFIEESGWSKTTVPFNQEQVKVELAAFFIDGKAAFHDASPKPEPWTSHPSLMFCREKLTVAKFKRELKVTGETEPYEVLFGYYHQSDPGIIIQSDPPKLSTRLIA